MWSWSRVGSKTRIKKNEKCIGSGSGRSTAFSSPFSKFPNRQLFFQLLHSPQANPNHRVSPLHSHGDCHPCASRSSQGEDWTDRHREEHLWQASRHSSPLRSQQSAPSCRRLGPRQGQWLSSLALFVLKIGFVVDGFWIVLQLLGKECYDIDIALDNMLGSEFVEKVREYLLSNGEQVQGVAVIPRYVDSNYFSIFSLRYGINSFEGLLRYQTPLSRGRKFIGKYSQAMVPQNLF